MTGRAEEFGKTAKYMMFAFVTAMILVYMVLASQFNSFIQPLIIMVAQPLAIIGGCRRLVADRAYAEYLLDDRAGAAGRPGGEELDPAGRPDQPDALEGLGIDEALQEACPIRMRPVLMTSATIILALSPAAFGLGAGAATNGPLAVAVIGGLISSTLLTLVVVPSVYSLVEHRVERFRRRAR